LDLSPQNWATLRGQGEFDQDIDAVIHNGATVHWTEGVTKLWPVNVESTVTLLGAALESGSIRTFVYVSGGAHLEGPIGDQIRDAPDGYTATKLIGQGLVQGIASKAKDTLGLHVSTVKPGFIVGDRDGLANPRDYLWRFVASVVRLGVYDQSTRDRWIAVSTSANIATKITDRTSVGYAMSPDCLTSIDGGLYEKELWNILSQQFGYELHPVAHSTWAEKLQNDLEASKEAHLLWPLYSFLENQDFGIGRADAGHAPLGCTKHLHDAIISNVEHLCNINFLPPRVVRRELKRKFEES
jgi:thioester reductase-like protein